MFIKNALILLGFHFSVGSAFSETSLHAVSSGMFQISADVNNISYDKEKMGYQLTFDGKEGGFFGCGSAKTSLKWPGLEQKINDMTMYGSRTYK